MRSYSRRVGGRHHTDHVIGSLGARQIAHPRGDAISLGTRRASAPHFPPTLFQRIEGLVCIACISFSGDQPLARQRQLLFSDAKLSQEQ